MRKKSHNAWTDEQMSKAKLLWENTAKTSIEIGHEIGRTKNAVIGQAHRQRWITHQSKARGPRGPRKTPYRPSWPKTSSYRHPTLKHALGRPLPQETTIGKGGTLWTEGVAPVSLADLAPQHCRWPLEGRLYCGGVAETGSSYCYDHHLIAHSPEKPKPFDGGFIRRFG